MSRSRSHSVESDRMQASEDVAVNGGGAVASKTNGKSSRSRSRSHSESRSRSASRSKSRTVSRSRSHSAHSKSKSRSRTKSKSKSAESKSRSRSRSKSPRRKAAKRSRSRDRKRRASRSSSPYHKRSHPSPCRVLGVFGLSLQTDERDLKRAFEKYGRLDKVKLVTDPRTNKSRGFAFIYFNKVDDAEEAKDNLHGYELDGHHLRVEYSISNREHNPTPGIYMGTGRSYRNDSYRDRGGRGYDDRGYGGGGGGGGRRGYGGSSRRSRSRSNDRRRRSYSRD